MQSQAINWYCVYSSTNWNLTTTLRNRFENALIYFIDVICINLFPIFTAEHVHLNLFPLSIIAIFIRISEYTAGPLSRTSIQLCGYLISNQCLCSLIYSVLDNVPDLHITDGTIHNETITGSMNANAKLLSELTPPVTPDSAPMSIGNSPNFKQQTTFLSSDADTGLLLNKKVCYFIYLNEPSFRSLLW